MTVRILIAACVAASGLLMYAVAAVLWDRRRQLPLDRPALALITGLFVVIGTGLLVGSCVGPFRF